MIFNFGPSKKAGIYKITNIESNIAYIGSSCNVYKRCLGHRNILKKKRKGANQHFLNSYHFYLNKNGNDDFLICDILEEVLEAEIDNLKIYEEKHIQKHIEIGHKLFNFRLTPSKEMLYTNDFKEKLSNAHIGIRPSEETKQKMSNSHKGLNIWSKGKPHKDKGKKRPNMLGMNHPRAVVYDNIELRSSDGTIYTKIECPAKFAREHGLTSKALNKLLRGVNKSHLGWKMLKR
jgi:group I intron endonuclease